MTDIFNRKAAQWAQEQHLDPSLAPTLIAVARCANAAGDCYASQLQIAILIGKCERTARRKLHALKAAGLIDIEPRYDDNHERQTSRITLRGFAEEELDGAA